MEREEVLKSLPSRIDFGGLIYLRVPNNEYEYYELSEDGTADMSRPLNDEVIKSVIDASEENK